MGIIKRINEGRKLLNEDPRPEYCEEVNWRNEKGDWIDRIRAYMPIARTLFLYILFLAVGIILKTVVMVRYEIIPGMMLKANEGIGKLKEIGRTSTMMSSKR